MHRDPVTLTTLLSQRFPLRNFELLLAGHTLSLTTAQSMDELIDRITEDEFRRDERLPYWAELWHSSIALAEYIAEHPELTAQRNVLEIGCGLGLPGIIASRTGATVTYSDYDNDALLAAELNHACNASGREADFILLDYRSAPSRRWEVVLASDIVYERRMIEPALNFLRAAVSEDGCFILAEPNRRIAEPFIEGLRAVGFHVEHSQRRAVFYDRPVEVGLYVGRTLKQDSVTNP